MRFLGFDSLDALRTSLTAKLGRELPDRESTEDFEPEVGRLLLDEARANERRIAALRLTLSLVYLALTVASPAVTGVQISLVTLLAAEAWALVTALLYLALRRGWYRMWLRRAAPTADAIAIIIGATLAAGAGAGTQAARTANVSLLCGFLVFTGALRLTRLATRLSSTLAILAFLAVAFIAHLPPLPAIGIVAGLMAMSVLSGRATEAIRSVIATEVGRTTMVRRANRADARAVEAQAASAAREEVLRIVAHDLRNPLSTILMAADLLGEPSMTEESRAKQAAVVKRTGARMNRLIHDLLNVARLDTGRMTVEVGDVDPVQLIANAVELMQPLANEASISLVADATEPLPHVSADAERIGQVFSNLIGNAIKFTPAGGTITLRAELADARVWFSVTDTGAGIPPEQLEQVFGQFWQGRKTDRRGIGLGLTIARGIVEAHGGTIGVDSEVGVGTRFWFGLVPRLGQ
ncbi:MAG: Two-component hybrid sensor and regulator [Gemmatimonadetes bacterium]|nr:Two-component hybrid sensor and regulator [Gemmatimonadota bacterium]